MLAFRQILLWLDVPILDDFRPLGDLGVDRHGECIRRATGDFDTLLGELVAHVRLPQYDIHVAIEECDYFCGCTRRREQRVRRDRFGGELAWVRLPNSGVAVDIPLLTTNNVTLQPDESVTPDDVVERTFAARAADRDEEMAAMRKVIAQNR